MRVITLGSYGTKSERGPNGAPSTNPRFEKKLSFKVSVWPLEAAATIFGHGQSQDGALREVKFEFVPCGHVCFGSVTPFYPCTAPLSV
jgi:hypothetical protein